MKTLSIILLAGVLSLNYPVLASTEGETSAKSTTCKSATIKMKHANTCSILKPADEPYADDLPFNTAGIFADYQRKELMKSVVIPEPEPEAYADDIPFNTCLIFTVSQLKAWLGKELDKFRRESEAADFPYNTAVIAGNSGVEPLPLVLTPENEADDIPFDTRKIAAVALQRNIIAPVTVLIDAEVVASVQ